MKRLFCLATAVGLLASRVSSAKDNYTFGEVPPPSQFPGLVDYSRATPAVPAAVPPVAVTPPARTNPVLHKVIAPVVVPRAEKPRPVSAAPVVVAPKPVVTSEKSVSPPAPPVASTPIRPPGPLVVKAGGGISGKVIMADARGRFVILNFPFGQMPTANAPLDVYRNGVKVGEVKITGPQRDDNTAADVVSGELQTGDVARNR